MFPEVIATQPAVIGAGGGGWGVQPVAQRSVREPRPPLDHHIEAMPDEYKDLEVIHNRSQLVVTRKNVRRFHTTNPSVIEIVQYSPNEFSIIGLARGTTDLLIWFEGENDPLMYLVTVIPDPSLEERRRIDYGRIERKLALLYPNSKVYLIPMSRKVIVRGQAKDAEEASRIMNIVRGEILTQDGALFAGYATDAAVAGGAGYGAGYDPNLPGGGNFGTFGGDILSSLIVNELTVPGEFQVLIRVRIAELNRSMLREFGINWNSIIEIHGDQLQIGTNMGGGNIISLTGIFDDFTINTLIDALASNGTVKILEDASLVTLSGQPAAFLSGGEFAVPTTVGLNGVGVGTTTFRGFGTSIIATPTIVDNDLIRLQIVPELSQTSGQNAVGGIPGLNVKRVQTRVELREGQTIVLGGLFSRQTSVEQTRVPLLGEIPVVGSWLFHSKRATEDEKELLIVVTPEIVRPLDADQTPPMPGWYVTPPDNIDFYHLNRTEGSPDLGHYQLLPYGNGQGQAHDVGYNLFNPPPADGRLAPLPTVGTMGAGPAGGYPAVYGYSGGYGHPYANGYGAGAYAPAPAYGSGDGAGGAPSGYAPLPMQPPMPPAQYQYTPATTPGPQFAPQPTPLAPAATGQATGEPSGIRQVGGVLPSWPRRNTPARTR
jgi:pilus assembly protein CpaC